MKKIMSVFGPTGLAKVSDSKRTWPDLGFEQGIGARAEPDFLSSALTFNLSPFYYKNSQKS